MSEIIIIVAFVMFGLLPILASGLTANSTPYKDNFILGNGLVLILSVFIIVALLIITSINHVFFDGISICEVTVKIYTDLKQPL